MTQIVGQPTREFVEGGSTFLIRVYLSVLSGRKAISLSTENLCRANSPFLSEDLEVLPNEPRRRSALRPPSANSLGINLSYATIPICTDGIDL